MEMEQRWIAEDSVTEEDLLLCFISSLRNGTEVDRDDEGTVLFGPPQLLE